MRGITDTEERLARRFLERTNEYLPPDFATLHDDVVLVAVDGAGGRTAHYRGHHGIRDWLGDPAKRAWSGVHVHGDELRRAGRWLVVLGRITRGEVESPLALRFAFDGGLIVRIEVFASHEEALRVGG